MQAKTRRIAIGATAVALLATGGGAYAATQSGAPARRDALLADAAKRLHVTPKQLTDALQGAANDQVEAAVRAGKLTRQQADRIEQRSKRTGAVPFLGGPHGRFGGHFGPGGPGRRLGMLGGLDAAASALGLSPAQLRAQLRDGKSLADIAKARDKDLAAVKAALRNAAKGRLDAAVKAGRLSRAQADGLLQRLDAHVDELLQRRLGAWHRRSPADKPA